MAHCRACAVSHINGSARTLSFGSGTIAPGNSIGTLNVSGDVAFASGSHYQAEINAANQGDRISATGKAALSGGTVQIIAAPGSYTQANRYDPFGQLAGGPENFEPHEQSEPRLPHANAELHRD